MTRRTLLLVFISAVLGAPLAYYVYDMQPTARANALDCQGCNVVLISLTNTRKDHLGIYGYAQNTSPNIDAFFQGAFVFERAFAPASWTLPVIVSLYTSTYPYEHGVMGRHVSNALPEEAVTLPELFRNQGYRTAAFTGKGDHDAKFNVDQGFESYESDETKSYGPLKPLVPQAVSWLKDHKSEKFFLMLQGYDTHCPFTPSKEFNTFDPSYAGDLDFSMCLWTFDQVAPFYKEGTRYWPVRTAYHGGTINEVELSDRDITYMKALYDGEISEVDASLKDLFATLEELGLNENTVVIFMSEHGDLFGEHGRFMRGGALHGTFYEPVLNFPLLVKHPHATGGLVDALIETVDLMPTFVEMFGLDDPQQETRQGISLIPYLLGKSEAPHQYVYAGSTYVAVESEFFSGISTIEAIRDTEWKLIKEEIFDSETKEKFDESYELYHISADPLEEQDVYESMPEVAESLKQKLAKWSESVN